VQKTEEVLKKLLQSVSYSELLLRAFIEQDIPKITATIDIDEKKVEVFDQTLARFNGQFFPELGVTLSAYELKYE
jgi:hypothetical protein